MAKFNAQTAVEAMEIDFTAFGGPALVIPEPSSAQVEEFMNFIAGTAARIKSLASEAEKKELDGLADDEIIAAARPEAKAMEEGLYEALVRVTSEVITVEQIKALPYRVQNAFAAWLARELNPESNGTATRR